MSDVQRKLLIYLVQCNDVVFLWCRKKNIFFFFFHFKDEVNFKAWVCARGENTKFLKLQFKKNRVQLLSIMLKSIHPVLSDPSLIERQGSAMSFEHNNYLLSPSLTLS